MVTTKKLALIFVLAALAHSWVLPLGFRGGDFSLLSNSDIAGREGLTLQWLIKSLPVSAPAFRVLAVLLWAGVSILIARTTAHLAGPKLGANAGLLAGLIVALSAGASGTLTTVVGLGALLAVFFMLFGFELFQAAHTYESRRTLRRLLGAVCILFGALSHPIALLLPLIMAGLLVFPYRQRELTRNEASPAIVILIVLFIAGLTLQQTLDTAGHGVQTPVELMAPDKDLPRLALLHVGMQAFAPWSRAQVFEDLAPVLGTVLTYGQVCSVMAAVLIAGFFLLRGTRRAILVTVLLGALFSATARILPAGAIGIFPESVAPTRPETLLPLLVMSGSFGLVGAAAFDRLSESKAKYLPVLLSVLLLVSTIDSAVHVARTEARADQWRNESIADIQSNVRSAIEQGLGGKNTLTLALSPPLNVGGIAGLGRDLSLALAPPFQKSKIEIISSCEEQDLLNLLNARRSADPGFARKAIQLMQPITMTSVEDEVLHPLLPRYRTSTPLRLGWQAPLSAGSSTDGLVASPAPLAELPRADPLVSSRSTKAWRFTPAVPAHGLSAISFAIPEGGLRGMLQVHLASTSESAPREYPIHFDARSPAAPVTSHVVNLGLDLMDHLAAPLQYVSWVPSEATKSNSAPLAPTLVDWKHSPSLLEPGSDFVLDLSENCKAPRFHISLPTLAAVPEYCDLEMRLFIPRLLQDAKAGRSDGASTALEVSARARPNSRGPGELFATPTLLGPTDSTGAPRAALLKPFNTYLATGLRQALIREGASTGLMHMRVHLRGKSGMDLGTTPWQSAHFTTKSKEPKK